MARWTFYSCGKCKERITTEAQDTFYAIGIPYVKCEHCGTFNDRSSQRNEWDLMSGLMRGGIYATVAFFGIFGGVGGAAILVVVAESAIGFSRETAGMLWLLLSIVGAAIGVKLCWQLGASSAIRESRARLSDASYVGTLLRLCFAHPSQVAALAVTDRR
jgi:hypothetical protein